MVTGAWRYGRRVAARNRPTKLGKFRAVRGLLSPTAEITAQNALNAIRGGQAALVSIVTWGASMSIGSLRSWGDQCAAAKPGFPHRPLARSGWALGKYRSRTIEPIMGRERLAPQALADSSVSSHFVDTLEFDRANADSGRGNW